MRHKAIEIVCAHVGHSIRGVSLKTNSGNLRRDSKDIGVSRYQVERSSLAVFKSRLNRIIKMQLYKGFVPITKKKATKLRGIWLQIARGRSSDALKIMDSFFTVCSLKYARKLISHAMLHFPIIISPFIPVLCSAELCSNVCSGPV
jgi:hypothetical protein